VAQKYVPISQIDDQMVDFRTYALIAKDDIIMGDHLWSRSDSVYGSGKLNTHQQAGVTPVFRIGADTPGLIGLLNFNALERAKSAEDFLEALQPRKAKITEREKTLVAWLAKRFIPEFLAATPNRTQSLEFMKSLADPDGIMRLALYTLEQCHQISEVQGVINVVREKLPKSSSPVLKKIEEVASQKTVGFMESQPKWQANWSNLLTAPTAKAKIALALGYLKTTKTPADLDMALKALVDEGFSLEEREDLWRLVLSQWDDTRAMASYPLAVAEVKNPAKLLAIQKNLLERSLSAEQFLKISEGPSSLPKQKLLKQQKEKFASLNPTQESWNAYNAAAGFVNIPAPTAIATATTTANGKAQNLDSKKKSGLVAFCKKLMRLGF